MAIQNNINKKTASLTLDNGSGNDPYVQYDINTTNKFRSGVDATDDSLCLAIGNAIGTNSSHVIDSDGASILPLQPAFYAYADRQIYVTGNGTLYSPVVFANESYDIGGNFTPATGTFVASVDGIYTFFSKFILQGPPGVFGLTRARLITTSRTYVLCAFYWDTVDDVNNFLAINLSQIAYMDSGDDAYIDVVVSGGSKTIDIYTNCSFIGCLLS